jgi:hypothetical protein
VDKGGFVLARGSTMANIPVSTKRLIEIIVGIAIIAAFLIFSGVRIFRALAMTF